MSGYTLTIQVRKLPGVRWLLVNVSVNGRHVKTITRPQITKPVRLTGLPASAGTFVLSITARPRHGPSVTATRTYRPCLVTRPGSVVLLTVSVAGSGSGGVTGGGISCPRTCSKAEPRGQKVSLTATPSAGSTFAGWSGAGCSGTKSCTLALTAPRSVTATFTAKPVPSETLTVSLAGTGSGSVTGSRISCPGTCSDSYTAGTIVTLTAAAASGSSFAGWSGGGCTGTGTCTVTMTAAQAVTATFTSNPPPSYTLTVGLAGTGSGTATGSGISCPGTCSDSYTAGTMVTLTAAAASGSSFAGWSAGGCSGTGTCTVTMSSDQSVTATFTTGSPTPGSYTISSSQDVESGSLYVSPDGTELQDVTVPTALVCAPSYDIGGDHVQFASIAIDSDGSFNSGSVIETGVIANSPATFTYTMSGQFKGTQVTGSLQEDITFDNGTTYSCTTSPQTWSATRDSQGTQTTPQPGRYTVSSIYQAVESGSLYVSSDGTELQDVTVPTALACTPSYKDGIDDHVQFASIAIGGDGSFNSGSVAETGVIDNEPATFTYTFSGNFHGSTTAGVERIAGELSELITFNNGSQISCTTNPQTWLATRDSQGTQTTSPQPGSYTVSSTYQAVDPGSLYVSSDGTELQDVTVPTYLACSPSYKDGIDDHVQFASIAIGGDGSFNSGSVAETGVIDNEPATFTYTFSGNFHGSTTAGVERIAGELSELITFNNGSQISCTTNPQTWSATRDSQGTQTTSPQPGSYTVSSTYQAVDPGSFTVSSSGTELQNVTVPTYLACSPSYKNGIDDDVQFASIAIGSGGSFNSGSVIESGMFDNEPATFTYMFGGNFHGTNSKGEERAAGELIELITFNNGSEISCATNPQMWSATGP
ncbi:MAG: InlB B-repeat-containing protein [Solirubrobacteraceae bacterium]